MEVNMKLDEASRTLNDFDAQKKKLAVENGDHLRQLEEVENQINQLNNLKLTLTTQLEDTKKAADDESRVRFALIFKELIFILMEKGVVDKQNELQIKKTKNF